MTYKGVRAAIVFCALVGTSLTLAGAAYAADSSEAPAQQSLNSGTTQVSIDHNSTQVTDGTATGSINQQTTEITTETTGTVSQSVNNDKSAGDNSDSAQPDNSAGPVADQSSNSDSQTPAAQSIVPPSSQTPTTLATVINNDHHRSGGQLSVGSPTTSSPATDINPPADPVKTPGRAPLPAGGVLGQFSSLMGSVTLPLALYLSGGLVPASRTAAGTLSALILVSLVLLASNFVSRLRLSGFYHGARSDIPAGAPYFAAHREVSFLATISRGGAHFLVALEPASTNRRRKYICG